MTIRVDSMNSVHFVEPTIASVTEDNCAAPISTNPVEIIKNKINEEKKKKYNKAAITVGTVVAGVVATVALLNPKHSRGISKFLQKTQTKLAEKIEQTRNNFIENKIYKISSGVVKWTSNAVNFANNYNPFKDILFKNFCTKEKDFIKVKDYKRRKRLQKADKAVVSVMGKFHRTITRWFDGISRYTVKRNYKKSLKELGKLERLIIQNLDKLPAEERVLAETKLSEIAEAKKYYFTNAIEERLKKQSELMKNLERDFTRKRRKYGSDYTNKWINKGEHLINNMNYWPETILRPTREQVVRQGLEHAENFVGNSTGNRGIYGEVVDMLAKYTDEKELKTLEKTLNKAQKSLNKSSLIECGEYFDKKRDLTLGSAPTDIVTATIGLIIAGIALASADDKDRRLSKLVTGIIPAISGVGVSLAMTAALVSGGKGLLFGLLATVIMNRIGIVVDKYALGHKDLYMEKKLAKQQKLNKKEIE